MKDFTNLFETDQKNINREKWHNSYKNAIIDIYKIIDNSLSTNYPSNNITWDNVSINNLGFIIVFN